jgi:intergrase/recombinase
MTAKQSILGIHSLMECEKVLEEHLTKPRQASEHLFSASHDERDYLFVETQKKTGLNFTPKSFRFFFANKMSKLGVQDRFIDAFQGHIPRSVLTRHYTDYSLENLKRFATKPN